MALHQLLLMALAAVVLVPTAQAWTGSTMSLQSVCSRRQALNKAAAGALAVFGAAGGPAAALAAGKRIKDGPKVTLPSGIVIQDMTLGSGVEPSEGDRVAIHYSLFCNGFQVESSRESSGLAARPLGFNYGTEQGPGSVPKGLQLGMEGMKVGGRRKITIPSELAFGKEGRPPFVPGGATVMFDVSLWSVKPKGTNPNVTFGNKNSIF